MLKLSLLSVEPFYLQAKPAVLKNTVPGYGPLTAKHTGAPMTPRGNFKAYHRALALPIMRSSQWKVKHAGPLAPLFVEKDADGKRLKARILRTRSAEYEMAWIILGEVIKLVTTLAGIPGKAVPIYGHTMKGFTGLKTGAATALAANALRIALVDYETALFDRLLWPVLVTVTYPRSNTYATLYWPYWTAELDIAAVDRSWREVPPNWSASAVGEASGGSMQFAPRITALDGLFSTELLTIAYETIGYCLDYWHHIPGAFAKLLLSYTNLLAGQYAVALSPGTAAQSLASYAATVRAAPYAAAAILERYRSILIAHNKDAPEITAREHAALLERVKAQAAKDREEGRRMMIASAHKRNKRDAIALIRAEIKRQHRRMTYHAEQHEARPGSNHQAEHALAASLYEQAYEVYRDLKDREPETFPLTEEQQLKISKVSA